MDNNEIFRQSLQNFTRDFAYGGAIRHLTDKGYSVDEIIRDFDYPLSREAIEDIVNKHLQEKNNKNKTGKE